MKKKHLLLLITALIILGGTLFIRLPKQLSPAISETTNQELGATPVTFNGTKIGDKIGAFTVTVISNFKTIDGNHIDFASVGTTTVVADKCSYAPEYKYYECDVDDAYLNRIPRFSDLDQLAGEEFSLEDQTSFVSDKIYLPSKEQKALIAMFESKGEPQYWEYPDPNHPGEWIERTPRSVAFYSLKNVTLVIANFRLFIHHNAEVPPGDGFFADIVSVHQ